MSGSLRKSAVNSVMRNNNRVLHHMELAKYKHKAMVELGFCESNANWAMMSSLLSDVKHGRVKAADAAGMISDATGLDIGTVRSKLRSCYQTGLMEFHATDVCDLRCIDCHYRDKSDATIPYSSVPGYINALSPRAVTVTGGGEPNCYSSEGKNINDLVCLIREISPHLQIGLINNNTHIPDGGWVNHLSWQRSSVDAHDAATYEYIKGKDKYSLCIDNIYRMLGSDVPHVGVGFLYRKENISGMKSFLLDWHQRWKKMPPGIKAKINIQFRPISPAIERVPEHDAGSELESRTSEMVAQVMAQAQSDACFDEFLRTYTNFYSIDISRKSLYLHEKHSFSKCYNALLHRVLRSDGSEYPDFLLCNDEEMSLGNVLTSDNADDERIRIALGTFYFHHRLATQYCNDENCRQCWVSGMIERNWDSDISAMGLPDSCFF